MATSDYSGKITKFHPALFFKPVVILILFLIVFFYNAVSDAHSADGSVYFGWFKGKTEFSFVAISVTKGKVGDMQTESTVTSTYFLQNGIEGVKEVSVMKLNGKAQQPTEKIYLTSADANYIINPKTKMFFSDKGDYNSFNWSKVWQWTRKRSDSYENISKSAKPASAKVNNVAVECYSIKGITFCYNTEKQLLKYEGDAGGMHTLITFSEYKDKNIQDLSAEYLKAVKTGEYTKADNMFSL